MMDNSSSSQHDGQEDYNIKHDSKNYIPLHKAAMKGDWKRANEFLRSDPTALLENIELGASTALQIAIRAGRILFVEKLVQLMPKDALELQDGDGLTVLHISATSGKVSTARALVRKNPDLPQICNKKNEMPIVLAAKFGDKDMVRYLYSVTRDEDPKYHCSPYEGRRGVALLNYMILADIYDVALLLIQKQPSLAITEDYWRRTPLLMLAKRSSAFKSGSHLGLWQRYICSLIHVEKASTPNHHKSGDMENPSLRSSDYTCSCLTQIYQVLQWLNGLLWSVINELVPGVKEVYYTKVMNTQALELLHRICTQISLLDFQSEMDTLLWSPVVLAAESGNVEVFTKCVEISPTGFLASYNTRVNILHTSIQHRQEKIFNLIKGMGALTIMAERRDSEKNNILHYAAILGPDSRLNSVTGAALQVQRELQWYLEIEKISQPTLKEQENYERKEPRLLFTETHKDMVEKGEKWMKETASSSMVVATLIATVSFAAAFTVPGGNNNDDGTPLLLKKKRFIVFAISNALALFSSLTSVLIFFSIITSRYAEEDFLKSLPMKLLTGLATLFFSMAATIITFSATFFIMLGHQLASVSLVVTFLSCLPVSLFLLFQYPSFVSLAVSTYGPSVFDC